MSSPSPAPAPAADARPEIVLLTHVPSDPAGYGGDLTESDATLIPHLGDAGFRVRAVPWEHVADACPAHPAAFVIRSTWNYQAHLDAFLATLRELAAPLLNPLHVVEWNTHKARYLVDLAAAGVAIPPMEIVAPPESGAEPPLLADVIAASDALGPDTTCVVVKPSVSASAHNTRKLEGPDAWADAQEWFAGLLAGGATLLVQPFLDAIVTAGEWSIICVQDVPSAAGLKLPTRGDFRVQVEYGGSTQIVPLDDVPTPLLTAAADAVAAAHRVLEDPTPFVYARVDGIYDPDTQSFVLGELELIEPDLWLDQCDPAVPKALAAAIAARTQQPT